MYCNFGRYFWIVWALVKLCIAAMMVLVKRWSCGPRFSAAVSCIKMWNRPPHRRPCPLPLEVTYCSFYYHTYIHTYILTYLMYLLYLPCIEISSELPSIVSSSYSSSKQQAQQLLNKVQNNLQSDFDVSKKVIKDGVKKISGKLFEFFDK